MKQFNNMETGYINEGGQLKSKNGQKYVINQNRSINSGYYISRGCAILYFMALIAMIIITALITYFIVCSSASSERVYNGNDGTSAVHTGSLLNFRSPSDSGSAGSKGQSPNSHGDGLLNDQGVAQSEVIDDTIEFPVGWSPLKYELLMEPNIETATSNGSVNIWVTRDTEKMNPIVINIREIQILSCKVFKVDLADVNEDLEVDCQYGKNNASYVITLKTPKYPLQNVTVRLEFISQLTSTMQGFYKGFYADQDFANDTWFVSTQFSPIDARRAFPCFDNPGKKATFQISIVRPSNKKTYMSNMPVASSAIIREGYTIDHYKETPRMSAYLVAFHISDLILARKADNNNDLPKIQVFTRREYKDMTDFGYDLTAAALPFFEEYFDIKFQLPKIDIVAVPDFGFNAMENWGLIIFRESAFLVPQTTNKSSSVEHMTRVANTLVHEIAHQWFGNLVTMKWYDDLWLKEGFSTYLSYMAVGHIKHEWNHFKTLPITEFNKAMSKDSDILSHAISFPVTTESDIRRIFDPISYSKGASIVNMMRGFLGEGSFRAGLRNYLKKYEFSNALQDDLWETMTEQAHKDGVLDFNLTVKEIMDTWTVQAGYPVVHVTRNDTNLVISQQRYMLPAANLSDTTKWFVPISIATNQRAPNDEIPEYWITNQQKYIEIENVLNDGDYLYLNINRTGYYRVNYDSKTWMLLIKHFEVLPELIRAQLVDDSFQLARAEFVDYDTPLTFCLVIPKKPHDYLTWWALDTGLEYITNMIKREPAYESYRAVMRNVIKVPYELLGFDELPGESHEELLHRSRIVKMACEFGLDRCMNKAQILFREWLGNKYENKVPPNLKDTIYCIALREGGVAEWNFAFQQFLETDSASEKEVILTALGCTQKPWLLNKYLNLTVSATSGIRKQDGARAFSSVARNIVGYEIAFDFLYTNIEEIAEYFGDGFSTLSKMIDSLTTFMNKEYQKEQFERFAQKANKLGLVAVEKSIKLAEIEVDKNIFWRSRSYNKLKEFLEKLIDDLNININ